MAFMVEELEALEPIDEGTFEPLIPSINIDGVCIYLNPIIRGNPGDH